jgi:MFS family permease
VLLPIGFTLVAQRAGPQQVGRALAVLGLPVLLAPIFGPILGGVIIDDAALQWLFVVNLPIAAVAITAVALERDVRPVRRLHPAHRVSACHDARVARRLIDVGLFRSPGFRGAAPATALLAAALFGTLLALPLYYQLQRGRSALQAWRHLPIAGV